MKATLLLLLLVSSTLAQARDLVVFAAASLTDVLPAITATFEKENNVKIKYNFDASSRLARQIEAGAKADLYFSADKAWNDDLIKKKLVFKTQTQDLVSNEILLITHKKHSYSLKELKDLPNLKFKHLALAQESVPAGKYGMEALKKVGIYQEVKNKIVSADNVRNVLAWIIKDEVDLGIVFSTDAKSSSQVKEVLVIPSGLHSPVIYPVSLIGETPSQAARRLFDYFHSQKAKETFVRFGFKVLH